MNTHTLLIYRTKSRGPRKPREYRWRITARNGRKTANGGEGYRNFNDLVTAFRRLFSGSAIIRQLDHLAANHYAATSKRAR